MKTGSAGQRVAIVTGGASGMGEALCRELARRGVAVIVADVDRVGVRRVAAAIAKRGGRACAATLDVSREPEVKQLIEQTFAAHGRLDYVFNNAGIVIAGDARDLAVEHWRKVVDVNLYGVLYGTISAYPIMATQGFGHIVNTASASGLFPDAGNAPYCTAKHAVVGLTLTIRKEGADLGVKASVVCPGFVRTNIWRNGSLVNMRPPDGVEGLAKAQGARQFARIMAADRAARLILDGVARNRPVIVFPASIRLARLIYHLFPRIVERRVRPWHELRAFRTVPAAADPVISTLRQAD